MNNNFFLLKINKIQRWIFFTAHHQFFGSKEDQICYFPSLDEINTFIKQWNDVADKNGEVEYSIAKSIFCSILHKVCQSKNKEKVISAHRVLRKIQGLPPIELKIFTYERHK